MAYTKKTWTTSSRVSAESLNHLETQYDEVMSTVTTWNDHTSIYYTEAQCVVKFFSADYMGLGSGADADLLDGYHASSIIGTGLPVGAIVWWHKDAAITIPTGWSVCNGTNGTNDYRNKFVIGSSASYVLKSSYGASSVTPSTSSVTIGATAIDTTQMPAHTHSWTETHGMLNTNYNYSSYGYSGSFYYYNATTATPTSNAAGSGSTHTHAGSSVTFNSEANLPPYYALYLIQRVW